MERTGEEGAEAEGRDERREGCSGARIMIIAAIFPASLRFLSRAFDLLSLPLTVIFLSLVDVLVVLVVLLDDLVSHVRDPL